MPDEQETGFTFVDKRRAEPETDGPETTAPEPPQASTADGRDESAPASGSPFQVPHLRASDRIAFSINWLSEGAWIALGLVRDPATEKIERDLDGARILIDSIGYLVSKAEPGLDEETRRELRSLVRDLQLNFVQQQNKP